jgi:phospholipid/cholesterol/gamma-HCH transport system substrate-binding protein
MKVSNETKVGALTAISITLLILGFNFLKGKTLFKTGHYIYAEYGDTKGLMVSNPVYINGFQVGTVMEIDNEDASLHKLILTLKLKEFYQIPNNSVAIIKENPLGTPSINIQLGNATTFLNAGDTVHTENNPGMLAGIMDKLGPVGTQVQQTLTHLDSVLKNINKIFDPTTRNNMQEVIANINKTTASLVISSASIQQMLAAQSGSIAQSMDNINGFTKNLADNNNKVTQVLTNVETTTAQLAKTDFNGTVEQLKTAVNNLNTLITSLNSNNGTLGKLMHDEALYNQLNQTLNSANILLDDLRVHPKRYVSLSVFGKKDKTGPLMQPLHDSIPPKR